jgi:hypothetical protein
MCTHTYGVFTHRPHKHRHWADLGADSTETAWHSLLILPDRPHRSDKDRATETQSLGLNVAQW